VRILRILLPALLLPLGTGKAQAGAGPTYKDRPFMLARDPDLESLARKALALLSEGKYLDGAALLQKVISQDPREAVSYLDLDRGVGLLEEIRRKIRDLPPEDRRGLEKALRTQAAPLLERGLALGESPPLEEAVRRFPGTVYEERASWILAARSLEAGRAWEAASWFRRYLEIHPGDGAALAGLALCRVLQGFPPELPPGRFSVLLGGMEYSNPDLLSFLHELKPLLKDPRPWPSAFGLGRPMSAPPSVLTLGWQQPLNLSGERYTGFPVLPVTDGDMVYLCTGDSAECIDLLSGRLLWSYKAPKLWEPTKPKKNVMGMVSAQGMLSPPRGLVLSGTLCRNTFICPLRVGRTGSDASFRAISISASIPVRRLFAFDALTGKVLWHHASRELEKLRSLSGGWNTAGPPLGKGDRVFVPLVDYGQTVSVYVGCFSAETGEPLWRTRICSGQLRLNMFGNMTTEFVASPLTLREGVLYGSTNLGVAFALEAERGRLKWMAFYESIRPPDKEYTDEFYPTPAVRTYWGANPPLVFRDQVIFAPPDAKKAFALDKRNGKLLWRLRPDLDDLGRGTALRYILGARKGRIYFQGRGIVAVDPSRRRGRRLLQGALRVVVPAGRMAALSTPLALVPRGGLSKDNIYTVTKKGGIGVWNLDGSASPVMARSRFAGYGLFGREAARVGNVLVVPGVFLSAGRTLLSAFLSMEDIVSRTRKALETHPGDPNLVLTLASALLKRDHPGDEKSASALLEELLDRPGLPSDLRLRARVILRRALLARAGNALAGGKTRDALALTRKAVAVSPPGPMDLEARVLLADLLEKTGSWEEWLGLARGIVAKYPRGKIHPAGERREEEAGPWFLSRIAAHLGGKKETAPAAVAAWRKILEKFPKAEIGGKPAVPLARKAIAGLIETYGPEVYREVEARARALLESASGSTDPPGILRLVIERFPNSRAAGEALRRLADRAARRGRMGDLLKGLKAAPSGRGTPGFLRRLAEAAKVEGNLWLSAFLFERLASEFGDRVSDFEPDGGLTYARVALEQAPRPPRAGDALLSVPPGRKLLARVSILGGTFTKMLRPFTLGPRDPGVPLVFSWGSRLFARPALADEGALSRDLWSRVFLSPYQAFTTCFLQGRTLLLPSRKGIVALDALTGKGGIVLPYPEGYFLSGIFFRKGLIVITLEGSKAEEILLLAMDPFSGRSWGDRRILFPLGCRVLAVPGPEKIHLLGWRILDPGKTPPRFRLYVTDVDLAAMSVTSRKDEWLRTPLSLSATLDHQSVLATKDHLFLPVVNASSAGIRALPLSGRAREWEVDIPRGEHLSRVRALPGFLLLLTRFHRQGILRVLEESTGRVVQRILLGTQADFPRRPMEYDSFLPDSEGTVFLVSGSERGTRFLHGIRPGEGTAWRAVLQGHDFRGIAGVKFPVTGPGFACVMFPVLPPRGISTGPDLYVVDTKTGELLNRIAGLVAPGLHPQILAAGKDLLFAFSEGTLGVAGPSGKGGGR